MNDDKKFMSAALLVGKQGLGKTTPNPSVGAVIVFEGEIVAEGYTQPPGGNHAEIEALNAVPDDVCLSECAIYITLEPCCVFGRTPPCTAALLESGIREVIVGVLDPNPDISGAGIEFLQSEGIDVRVGCLEDECRRSNAPYFSMRNKNRPWIVAKYAMTLDGKIATLNGDSKWITNEKARGHVGVLRDRYDAIMVGTNTLIEDDPRLTSRIEGGHNPVRILVDRRQKAPLSLRALDGRATTILFAEAFGEERRASLESKGIACIEAPFSDEGLDLDFLCSNLRDNNIMSLLVEGGGTLLGSFFDKNLVDEVWAYIAPTILGGKGREPFNGRTRTAIQDGIHLHHLSTFHFEDNIVINGFVEV